MASRAADAVIISAPRVITALPGAPVLEPGYVVTAGDRITGAGQGPPPGAPDVELDGGVLVPGLVDLQVNGYFGVEMQAAEPDGWATVARRLPATGCTAFLPTFITAPVQRLATALGFVAEFVPGRRWRGARVLGVHLEGPFISPRRRGAHNPDWIVPPSPAALDELLAAGAGLVRLVTLAPEVDGGLAAVSQLAGAGVLVSVGHSNATAAQVAAAAAAGARMVTHLFNAQPAIRSREPGVAGQALADPRLTSGLIMDTHHVSPANCTLAFAAAPGRIVLVTDAAACAGMPPGSTCSAASRSRCPPATACRRAARTAGWPGRRCGSTGRSRTCVAGSAAAPAPGGAGLAESAAARVPGPRRPDRPAGPGPHRPGGRGRPGVARRRPAGRRDLDRW